MSYLDEMMVFNRQVQVVATEYLDWKIRTFNQASNYTLSLGMGDMVGDWSEEAFYRQIPNLINRRDAYADGEVSAERITQTLDVNIHVDRRVGPVEWTREQFRRIGQDQATAGYLIGVGAAEGILAEILDTLVATLMTCFSSITRDKDLNSNSDPDAYFKYDNTVIVDKLDLFALNQGAALFGDRSSAITTWIMDGLTYHGFIAESLKNEQRLFRFGNVNVMQDGLGRRFIVSDIPSLRSAQHKVFNADSNAFEPLDNDKGPRYFRALGLTPGAAGVTRTSLVSDTLPVLRRENLGRVWQGEYGYKMGVKGYTLLAGTHYEKKLPQDSNFRSPPTDVILDPASWAPLVSSVKDTAGVLVLGKTSSIESIAQATP
ncbi:MAG: major capsid protein [Candidatus Thiodiazotropha endolucinida]|nr:major capsid protein [Candidatus Thiodiazotropha taylori]MCW4321591.1 major capsid protein [Candidatus Thiodiazotropha taylori]